MYYICFIIILIFLIKINYFVLLHLENMLNNGLSIYMEIIAPFIKLLSQTRTQIIIFSVNVFKYILVV